MNHRTLSRCRIFTLEELNQIWTEIEEPYCLITQISYFASARLGEVISLKGSNVESDRIIFEKTKIGYREVEVDPQLRKYIKQASLPPNGYIFPFGDRDRHAVRSLVRGVVNSRLKEMGFANARLMDFRHSRISHVLAEHFSEDVG